MGPSMHSRWWECSGGEQSCGTELSPCGVRCYLTTGRCQKRQKILDTVLVSGHSLLVWAFLPPYEIWVWDPNLPWLPKLHGNGKPHTHRVTEGEWLRAGTRTPDLCQVSDSRT